MRLTVDELMTRLRSEGLGSDDDTRAVGDVLRARAHDDMPVYLRALVGLGAWVATLLLIGFFYSLHLLDDKSSALVFGIVLVVGAVWLRLGARGDFWRNTAVAASFAGQGLIVAAVDLLWRTNATAFAVAALLSVVMMVTMPDPLHRFVSAMIAVGTTAATLTALEVTHALDVTALLAVVVLAWTWRMDLIRRSDSVTEALAPIGYGLAVGLFGICLFGAFSSVLVGGRAHAAALGAITTDGVALALAALVLVILREHDTTPSSVAGVAILLVIALFAVITMDSPGILIGVAMLLLGFDRRNVVLIELAAAYLIVFGAANYYSMDLTLLEKSGILVGSGALCLAARLLVDRLLEPGKTALPE